MPRKSKKADSDKAKSKETQKKAAQKQETAAPDTEEVKDTASEEQAVSAESADEKYAELNDRYLRLLAEYDNYRKRTERDFLNRIQNANERLITDILAVLDDLQRSLAHANNGENSDNLLEGFELIYKKMSSILEKEGLEAIEATGHEFDPAQHDALMQMESDSHESGIIIEEHLKGYRLNDKVIRHSQVLVAK